MHSMYNGMTADCNAPNLSVWHYIGSCEKSISCDAAFRPSKFFDQLFSVSITMMCVLRVLSVRQWCGLHFLVLFILPTAVVVLLLISLDLKVTSTVLLVRFLIDWTFLVFPSRAAVQSAIYALRLRPTFVCTSSWASEWSAIIFKQKPSTSYTFSII